MGTFYDYPREHWQHLRTFNPAESPAPSLGLRTDAAKRYNLVDRAIAANWKILGCGRAAVQQCKRAGVSEDRL